jgi:hypothetical protein
MKRQSAVERNLRKSSDSSSNSTFGKKIQANVGWRFHDLFEIRRPQAGLLGLVSEWAREPKIFQEA